MDDYTIRHFWAKVNKNGPVPAHVPELGPCWVWEGNCNGFGYGMFAGKKGAKKQKAHRIAWELENGPHGLLVLHKCDNPACVRVSHLFLGTQLENVQDMRAKGRGSPPPIHLGEANRQAKLTPPEVVEIRALYAQGLTQTELGQRFGVNQTQISNIVLGRTWKHLPGSCPIVRPPNLEGRRGVNNANAKMTPERVRLLRDRYSSGFSFGALSKEFGVCPTTAKSIATRRTWKHVA